VNFNTITHGEQKVKLKKITLGYIGLHYVTDGTVRNYFLKSMKNNNISNFRTFIRYLKVVLFVKLV
jgi:hypothetical protein